MPADASKKWDPHRDLLYQWYCVDGRHMDDIRTMLQERFNLKAKERTLHNQFKRWEFPSRRPESIHEIPRLLPLVKEMYKKDYTSKEMTTCLREKYGIDVTERQLKSLRLRHQLYLKSGPACRVRHIIPLADIEVPAVESSSESVEGASDAAPRRPRAPAALKLNKKPRKSMLVNLPHELILHLFSMVDNIGTVRSMLLTARVFPQVCETAQFSIYGLAASKEFAPLARSVLDLWRPNGLPPNTRNFIQENSEYTLGAEDPTLSPNPAYVGTAEARRLNEDRRLVKHWLKMLQDSELAPRPTLMNGVMSTISGNEFPPSARGIVRHIDLFGKMSETEMARIAECIYHILYLAKSFIPTDELTPNQIPQDAIYVPISPQQPHGPIAGTPQLVFLPHYLFSQPLRLCLKILSASFVLSSVWKWARVLHSYIRGLISERIISRRARRLDVNALRETVRLCECMGVWDVGSGWLDIVEKACSGPNLL